MADALSSLLGGSQRPTDALVEAYKRTQQQPIQTLKTKKATLETRQTFFTSLRSKLESLSSSVSLFSDSTQSLSKFQARKAVSSDTSVATVSASADAIAGLNTLKVQQLAANDVLASDRTILADASGYTAGTKQFDISIGGTATTVSVTFDGTENNETALTKIADAINGTTDIGVTAGFLKDTSTTGRLTLTSKTTGGDNRIAFTDTDGVLSQVGITAALTADSENRTAFTSTSAGYLQSASSNLDAKFQINGIDVVRSSNTVSDALNGITITLLKTQDSTAQPLSITTSVDEQGVSSNINPLLQSFNGVINQLNNESSKFKDDFAVRSFRSSLRQTASNEFNAGTLKYLSDVGITADDNGNLVVSNLDRLKTAITDHPDDVATLFQEFAKKVDSSLTGLLGEDGLISARSTSITSQIKSINTRTSELEKRVDSQAESLRKQYESVLQLSIVAEQQFTLIGGLSSSVSS